ncbi:MAG: DUF3267 domain-containing protein [Microbacterium sp.]
MDAKRDRQDTAELPVTYEQHLTVDLKNKKLTLTVQGLFALVALVGVGVALLLGGWLRTDWPAIVTILVTLAACLVYMTVHEATHGAVLQLLTGIRPTYRMRFPFLTTGNHGYLTRRSAIIVALTPAVIWGVVLLVALFTLPDGCRLTAYIVLALNFAGSAGDFVEVYLVSRQPSEALVQDDGNSLHVFLPEE